MSRTTSRVQLALNVPDIDEAVAFYTKLFGTEPNKRKPGYANFAIADPPSSPCRSSPPGPTPGPTTPGAGIRGTANSPPPEPGPTATDPPPAARAAPGGTP